jgi:acetyl-CoA carboxylase carboxyltransferase component
VPVVTLVVRKAYGGAYAVMGCKQLGADVNLAWPTARIAVMGAESAVSIIGRRQIAAAGDNAEAVRQQMIDFYNATMATPWIAAERGYIDAVIEPSATRLELRRAMHLLRDKAQFRPVHLRKKVVMPL